MKITRVELRESRDQDQPRRKLLARANVILDGQLIVKEVKLIRHDGRIIVSMPCRKLEDACPQCYGPNALRAHFCNWCGCPLDGDRCLKHEDGTPWMAPHGVPQRFEDVVHPVNSDFRRELDRAVIDEWQWRNRGEVRNGVGGRDSGNRGGDGR